MSTALSRDVIITYYDHEDIDRSVTNWLESFRKDLIEYNMEHLLVGPVRLANGEFRVFFSSSGSVKGWPMNEQHAMCCKELLERFGHCALLVIKEEGEDPQVLMG